MTVFTMRHFDTLAYVKQAKQLGTTEELAEFQAKQIEQAIDVAVTQIESKSLVTKDDLQATKNELLVMIHDLREAIKDLEIRMLLIYGGGFMALLAVLARGFHWI